MTRIVDVPAALTERGYPEAIDAELHLRVRDDVLPANDGTFVLHVSGGKAEVRPGGTGAMASTSAGWLRCTPATRRRTSSWPTGYIDGERRRPPQRTRSSPGRRPGWPTSSDASPPESGRSVSRHAHRHGCTRDRAWTVAYHVALIADLRRGVTLLVSLVVALAVGLLVYRMRPPRVAVEHARPRRPVRTAITFAASLAGLAVLKLIGWDLLFASVVSMVLSLFWMDARAKRTERHPIETDPSITARHVAAVLLIGSRLRDVHRHRSLDERR